MGQRTAYARSFRAPLFSSPTCRSSLPQGHERTRTARSAPQMPGRNGDKLRIEVVAEMDESSFDVLAPINSLRVRLVWSADGSLVVWDRLARRRAPRSRSSSPIHSKVQRQPMRSAGFAWRWWRAPERCCRSGKGPQQVGCSRGAPHPQASPADRPGLPEGSAPDPLAKW